jgi:hypothetical protein
VAWKPALTLLVLAPVLGEGLSTATPPLELLLPWNLALFVALYGAGALLVRELVRRRGLAAPGLLLLAAAYAVWEEALVDRFWFTPARWHDAGLDGYSAVWHTNLLLAVHLTLFHLAVSIGGSIVVVERLFPAEADRPWLGRRGLVATGAVLLVVPPLLFGRLDLHPLPQVVAATALLAALVVAAFRAPRRPRRVTEVRAAGPVAFAATAAQFVLTYAVPSTGLPWPLGLAVALAPAVLGAAWLRHADPWRVVRGVLAFFAVLCVGVGLLGRYDTSALGVLVLVGLVALRR